MTDSPQRVHRPEADPAREAPLVVAAPIPGENLLGLEHLPAAPGAARSRVLGADLGRVAWVGGQRRVRDAGVAHAAVHLGVETDEHLKTNFEL